MKKQLFFMILTALLYCSAAHAQYDIELSGTRFTVFVNDGNMTCEIRDDGHKIDDRKYAYNNNLRKIKAFKKYKKGETRRLEIPEKVTINGKEYTVTSIGRAAFAGYSNIDYVKLPETVTQIGDYAFFRSSIRDITLPTYVSKIGKRIFGYCYSLRSITTMMGGVDIAKEDYAESKNCELKFKSEPGPIPGPVIIKPDIVKSDVDDNLPVANSKNENLFAVIIANEEYKSVAPVYYALHDGEIFKKYCQIVLGIPGKQIYYTKDATLNNMKSEVKRMKKISEACDGEARFIFYYAGHGFPDDAGHSSYLLPVDASSKDTQQGYNLAELYQELGALNTKSVVVFLDACFSGSLRGNGMLSSARSIAMATKAETPQKGNVVIFSAAQGDETANPYPDQGHGLFTYFLLKKLQTSPNTTLGDLSDYLKKEVRRFSTIDIDKTQTPNTESSPQISNSWRNFTLK